MCGCGKKASEPSSFVWTSPDGKTVKKDLRSEIEARALVIRQGGTYAPASK